MTSPSALVNPAVDSIALVIVGVSIYLLLRQEEGPYPNVKNLLVMLYVFFGGNILLALIVSVVQSDVSLTVLAKLGNSFILWDVCLLTLIAYSVYVKPSGGPGQANPKSLLRRFPHNAIIIPLFAFIAFSNLFIVFSPSAFSIVELPSLFGVLPPMRMVAFGSTWLFLAAVILLISILYSTSMLVLAARKAPDLYAKRALEVFAIAWTVIGVTLATFDGYLVQRGYDLFGPAYIVIAVSLAVTAFSFRRASTLASFFGPIEGQLMPVSSPFSARLTKNGGAPLSKGIWLLEADPSIVFEQVVNDFAVEEISNRVPVYLFSSRGTVVYESLSRISGMRLYTFSERVSFRRSADGQPNEMLVPYGDQSVLLDCISKTISTSPDQDIAIIYDSITEMVLLWGIEESYRVLRRATEILSQPNVTALFLIVAGAHDERTINLVKSLFPNHLRLGQDGLRQLREEPLA